MPKLKVYMDTSVLGAIYDVEDPYRVEVTKKLINILKTREEFNPYISNIVIEEIEKAPSDIKKGLKETMNEIPAEILYETDACAELVSEYLKKRIIPGRYRDDARHIAIAVINDIDVIATWNCRHMANIRRKRMINAVNMMLGYRQVEIVTPLEVVGYD